MEPLESIPPELLKPRQQIRTELNKALRNLTVATCFLFAGLLGLGGYIYYDSNEKSDSIKTLATKTNTASCNLRFDLERRIQASKDFLKEHPNGIPGLSAALIQKGIADTARTINALKILDCSKVPNPK